MGGSGAQDDGPHVGGAYMYAGQLTSAEDHLDVHVSNVSCLAVGAGVIAVWSIGDMVLFNRRKRKVWFAEQELNYDRALSLAIAKEADGTLTDDLAMVLRNERAILAYEEEQKERKSVWKRTKETLFGSLAKQERRGGALGIGSEELKRIVDGEPALAPAPPPPTSAQAAQDTFVPDLPDGPVVPVIENARPQVSLRPVGGTRVGGPLDQYAERTASSLAQTWANLFRRS